ncbi:MAG: chitobiase/beta-hexosaminidase C-terminal domain-containing protein, partial [Terracidiphilus sp.]
PGYDLVTGWGSPAGQNLIGGMAPKSSVGFQLSTSSSSLMIDPGSSGATTIAVIDQDGFAGSVNLSVTSLLPAGVTASFSTNPANGTSVLAIAASVSASTQSYLVTITGTSGANSATTYVTVNTPTNAVAITSPAMPQVPVAAQIFKPGTPIPIQGTVLGNPQSFSVQWARGISPTTGWTNLGVTLNPALPSSFLNQPIATWDTSSVVAADYYTVLLSATYSSATITSSTLVYLEPDLLSANWPRWLDISPSIYSSVQPVTDNNGNTGLGLVEPTYMGSTAKPRYRIFSLDGSSDISTYLTFGSYMNPVFGNLTVGGAGVSATGDARNVTVINGDATTSELPLNGENVQFQMSQVTLADLKGDSSLATLAVGIQNWNNLAFVFAWGSDGQLLNSNFPIQVPYANTSSMNTENPGLVAGDIDGDGKQEIIVQESTASTSFTLALFANDGTPLSWAPPTFPGTLGQVILADLDHNGKLETILVAMPFNSFDNMLHVLQPDGTERNGWPLDIGQGYIFLAAGDLARSGYDQIVAATHNNLFVLNSDGTPFSSAWPLPTSSFNPFGPVVLADIDGDGYPEILTSTADYSLADDSHSGATVVRSSTPDPSNLRTAVQVQTTTPDDTSAPSYFAPTLHAFRRDGTVSRSWKILGMHGEQPFYLPRLAVGDFNHDGTTDIAIVNGLISGGGIDGGVDEGTLEVLTTGAPYNPAANDWPMISHDTYNSATTASANPVTSQAPAPVFAPVAGAYSTTQMVTLSDATAGATIYYTTDGTAPTTGSYAYSSPIAVSSTQTIKAVAVAAGYTQSAFTAAAYTITPPAAIPTFTPQGGYYATVQSITITSATPSAAIYYTTDGTTPTTSSSQYKTPIIVSTSQTIQATAIAPGNSTSAVAFASYTIIPPPIDDPIISSLSPAFADAGGPSFALTIAGSGFASGAVVYWGTTALSTQLVSATQLTAQISAGDIATAGVTSITVQTPGASSSNTLQFEVDSASGSTSAPAFIASAATVPPGATASYPVTLSTAATNISATCLNLPVGATCSYSSATGAVAIATSTATPPGTYAVTAVFAETLPGDASALVLFPVLLLPLAGLRKKWSLRVLSALACLAVTLTAGMAIGCGAGPNATAPSTSTPTHQATSSGSISITVQ